MIDIYLVQNSIQRLKNRHRIFCIKNRPWGLVDPDGYGEKMKWWERDMFHLDKFHLCTFTCLVNWNLNEKSSTSVKNCSLKSNFFEFEAMKQKMIKIPNLSNVTVSCKFLIQAPAQCWTSYLISLLVHTADIGHFTKLRVKKWLS